MQSKLFYLESEIESNEFVLLKFQNKDAALRYIEKCREFGYGTEEDDDCGWVQYSSNEEPAGNYTKTAMRTGRAITLEEVDAMNSLNAVDICGTKGIYDVNRKDLD